MSLQFQPNLSIILAAFQRVGLQQGQSYANEQIYSALDQLTGALYERDVAQQLFDNCQSNLRGQVLLEDFAQTMIEADKILKKKISQVESQIQLYQTDLKDCQRQVQYEQSTQQNSYKIDKDSMLTVIIKNVQGIQFPDFQNSQIQITVDNVEQLTPYSSSGNKYNPEFNQQLQFSIQSGTEEVLLSLYVIDRNQKRNLVGQTHIDLGNLKDQQGHSINQQLVNSKGQSLSTIVYLEAQWIHNKVKFNQDLIKQQEQAIQQLYSDIDDFKRDLLVVQQPFLEANVRSSLKQSFKPTNQSKVIPQANAAQLYQQQQAYPNQVVVSHRSQQADVLHSEPGELSDELYFGFLLYILMLFLALFQCFARPDYIDLLLAMLYLIIVCRDCFEPNYIKMVGMVTVFSIILDIIWISIYKNWWSGTDQTVPTWGEAGDPIVRITIVFCIFNIILKTSLCYILFHYYQASLNDQKPQFNIWQFSFPVGHLKQNLFTQKGLLQ